MTNAHTPEPWSTYKTPSGLTWISAGDGKTSWSCVSNAEDANRIVACVNACAGLPQDDLEELAKNGVITLLEYVDETRKQRDELLAALNRLFDAGAETCLMWDGKEDQIVAIAKAREAIENAERTT